MEIAKKKKKITANIIFFVVVIVVLGVVIFSLNDIEDMINIIKDINVGFLFLGLSLMILHTLITNLCLFFIQTGLSQNVGFWRSIHISNTEYLFNAITPFSSGGQPFQAYYYMKNGLSGDEAVSVLVSNFTVYQFVLTVFSTIGILIFLPRVGQAVNQNVFVVLIGYIINTAILIGLFLISFVKGFKRLLKGFFKGLGKIKFLNKTMTKLEAKTFDFVENYQKGTKKLFTKKRVLIGATLLRILDMFIFYSIPIFIFLSLNVTVEFKDYLFVIMMAAFATNFMMWIPTPGATGGIEWAFTVLFTTMITSTSIVVAAMMIWRIITYYLGMVSGFVSYIIIEKGSKTYENRINS